MILSVFYADSEKCKELFSQKPWELKFELCHENSPLKKCFREH